MKPPEFVNPFLAPEAPSLAEVVERLEAADLEPTRKRDLVSAVRRIGGLAGQPLEKIPAEPASLRALLETINPAQHGLSAKTLSNIRSNLFAALAAGGVPKVLKTAKIPLAPAWAELLASAGDGADGKRIRIGLSRLARYCSVNGVDPAAVNDEVMAAFAEALCSGTLVARPQWLARDIAMLWNRLAARTTEPRLQAVVLTNRRPKPTRVEWESLPESFREDVEAHLAWAAGNDPFAEEARPRPLSSGSIKLRRQQIQTAVTALIATGLAPERLGSLADLVSPDAYRAILRQRHEEADQKANTFNAGLAKALVAIASEWVHPEPDVLAELKRMRGKLPAPELGLTAKNKALLRSFDDPSMRQRLIELPWQLWRELEGKPLTSHTLARYQGALAIAILLFAPLRVGNLATLAFEETLFLPSRDDQETRIAFKPEEMKNREPFQIVVPPRVTALLRRYARAVLGPFLKDPPRFVFDNGSGEAKGETTLSFLIERIIKKHLGIKMTAHQFRHLAAKILLDAEPGAFETVKQLLGHRNLKTTVNSYAGIDSARAARHHARLVEAAFAEEEIAATRKRRPPARHKRRKGGQ